MEPYFYNRKNELDFLNAKFKTNNFELIVIYGRRRVGKSELITNFCTKHSHIYFIANKRGTENNAIRITNKTADFFNDFQPNINNFEDYFKYLIQKIENLKNKKFIVCIDEFSYLIEKDPDITSEFQVIIDELLKKKNIMLILCGSSISMMEQGVLAYKSPLYGRRTGQWKLTPFKLKDLYNLFRQKPIEKFIEIYSVFGDLPAYFSLYDKDKDLMDNIKENILTKGTYLYKEAEILLKEEFREPDTYFDILKAISMVSKPSKIANLSSVNEKDLPKYMKNIIAIDLVKKENPATMKKDKTKTTQYFIKDSYIDFWYNFVYPNFSDLEEKNISGIAKKITQKLDKKIEKRFEDFCTRLIKEKIINSFEFTKIGRQWGKIKGAPKGMNTYEIDIVALNYISKEILFCECKWSENVDADKILSELKQKAEYVDWHTKKSKISGIQKTQGVFKDQNKRKETYAIFAKGFKTKEVRGVKLYDLNDLEKLFK